MEFCRATSFTSWRSAFAVPPSNRYPRHIQVGRAKQLTIWCLSMEDAPDKTKQMVVSITGATGFIGKRLVERLRADNHAVRILTRSRAKAQKFFPANDFPGIVLAEEIEWKDTIEGSTAVVNLAGMPISTRWSQEIKKEIKDSRIRVTSKVVDIINQLQPNVRPSVLVSATAVGYYGTSETAVFDETSPSGNDFLAENCSSLSKSHMVNGPLVIIPHGQAPLLLLGTGFGCSATVFGVCHGFELQAAPKVCREWEGTALKADKDVRVALIRIGVVLGKDGGALAKMIPLFMMFAGGPLGSGKQWFSWIHLDDIVNLIYEALSNPSYNGVINGTSPNPVRLAELCNQLGGVMGRPSWLPVPEFALKAVLGEGACVVLEGQKVVPARAKQLGFSFKYPYVKDALRAIWS